MVETSVLCITGMFVWSMTDRMNHMMNTTGDLGLLSIDRQ